MTQPDFSEFSFGYGVTRYIEDLFGGRRVLPNFPTQNEEADGGYDVDLLAHGVPLFIQFKRSEIMTRRSATEYKLHPADWELPIYRMHLHGHNEFRQHYLLQGLEDEGNTAVYITSQVRSKALLNQYYEGNRILEASRMFFPSEIVLPDVHQRHHVSFNSGAPFHRVYSETGERMESRMRQPADLIEVLRQRSKGKAARTSLEAFITEMERLTPEGFASRQRRRRPVWSSGRVDRRDDELNGRLVEASVESPAQMSISSRIFFERLSVVQSVARRAAILAHREADAHLVIVPQSALG
ncbi:hypothetical protein G6L16_025995 (plasmid) [Agrobacterium tumefaciens]|uniref:hypothetical protein n=1 Tax=Agrobacterium tumefaciens TaxID=358 RepID=UPI001572E7C2|nr:hypothetical protein [Agrobacterium tumefaciens]NSZ66423.1 hypothetical protein [Agrobacterium tumefaciens]NTA72795.1 hypothetical protein [Agrobacterium tumefaciens]WIE41348.1 hypothetical protein G6L16_025995 [Agrobacterium tumefaciens]